MADDRFQRMREVYGEAVTLAPALRARFAQAGLSPQDLASSEALDRMPVLKKERLMELQQADPPFAGYLACRPEEIGHIYASPGPIFEPSLAADKSGHGMDMMFAAAGIGPGDLVLNRLDGPIARLTLNDPERANVLSAAMMETLAAALAVSEPAGVTTKLPKRMACGSRV